MKYGLAAAIVAALFAFAGEAGAAPYPTVELVPANSNPPVPAGLKVTCMEAPDTLSPSTTCPVVKYNGITTWAYSFIDNRVAFALVSYDANNRVVSKVTKNGARYVWMIVVSTDHQSIAVSGQSNQSVIAQMAELSQPIDMPAAPPPSDQPQQPPAPSTNSESSSGASSATTFKVCNRTSWKIAIAMDYMPVGENDWREVGWFTVTPGDCASLATTNNRYIYARGEGLDGANLYWGGDAHHCVVNPGPYDFRTTAGGDCPQGEAKEFKSFYMPAGPEFTWNLDP